MTDLMSDSFVRFKQAKRFSSIPHPTHNANNLSTMFYLSGGFAFLPCRLLFAVVYKRIGKMQIYCIVIRLSVHITLLLVMLQFSLRFLANFFRIP